MGFLARPSSETQITHLRRLWLYGLCAIVLFFLVAPSLIVVPMSFSASDFLEFPPRHLSLRWYVHYFETPEWREATFVSVRTAVLTVVCATPIGTAAAYALRALTARRARFIGVSLLLPMMVPIILIAVGLFFVYVRLGLLNTLVGLVIGHTLLAIPFVLIVVSAGLKTYDMNLERAARSLGASRLKAFLKITLPQIRFSVVSAALFAFVTSFDEVIIALFVSTGPNSTLTRRMFLALRDAIDPTIAAISSCLMLLSILLLLVIQICGTRRVA